MLTFLTTDNVKLSFIDKGAGEPIVFVHGWSASRLSFNLAVRHFSRQFRVIAYDQRGHGDSEAPEYGLTLSRLAADLEELLHNLNLQQVVLVGWSMGAHVLFEYVKNYGCGRLKGAVVIDMSPKILNDDSWKLGVYHGQYTYQDGLKELSLMCDNWPAYVEQHLLAKTAPALRPGTSAYELTLRNLQDNVPHVMYALWLAMLWADYREAVKMITVPTLIMYGELSPLYKAETANFLHAQIPDSRLVPFAKSGHALALDEPDLFNKTLEGFLREID